MSGQNFIVPARSWPAIEKIALEWRFGLGLDDVAYMPIIEVMEQVLDHKLGRFTLLIEDASYMGAAEGLTDPNGEFIMLREDVYRRACQGNPRDRFTAAHEFGHWVMHTQVQLARASPGEMIKPFRLSEPQANQFASEILMPKKFFSCNDNSTTVMKRHGVSVPAATNRLEYLRRKQMI
jgi:Zn-dependent peptidase ImmA (M78 family)